ncbi:hypothetical protein LAZ67_18002156 [Cordylochernes scorpioides]|uniref:Uncharacterized protein n=1 Tax=Cordylochernes scorpioides TaxID=51811 RepID=A0ABY6LIZ4_9ARAC|nr:hypothetical protein LAZ67_18002156 [Cordylochernes scorpioides]
MDSLPSGRKNIIDLNHYVQVGVLNLSKFFGHIARHREMEYIILTGKTSERHIPGRPPTRGPIKGTHWFNGRRDGTTIEEIQENDLEQMTGDLTDKNGSRTGDHFIEEPPGLERLLESCRTSGDHNGKGHSTDQESHLALRRFYDGTKIEAEDLHRIWCETSTETFEMLNKAFPNDAPKRTTVFEWHSRFKAVAEFPLKMILVKDAQISKD